MKTDTQFDGRRCKKELQNTFFFHFWFLTPSNSQKLTALAKCSRHSACDQHYVCVCIFAHTHTRGVRVFPGGTGTGAHRWQKFCLFHPPPSPNWLLSLLFDQRLSLQPSFVPKFFLKMLPILILNLTTFLSSKLHLNALICLTLLLGETFLATADNFPSPLSSDSVPNASLLPSNSVPNKNWKSSPKASSPSHENFVKNPGDYLYTQRKALTPAYLVISV